MGGSFCRKLCTLPKLNGICSSLGTCHLLYSGAAVHCVPLGNSAAKHPAKRRLAFFLHVALAPRCARAWLGLPAAEVSELEAENMALDSTRVRLLRQITELQAENDRLARSKVAAAGSAALTGARGFVNLGC